MTDATHDEDVAEPDREDFRSALCSLLNRFSMENRSNTPDFILRDFICDSLRAFDTAVQQRETWYGRDARPTSVADARAESNEHRRLVTVVRHIAESCSHTPSLRDGDHIHEPTTGGERFCGPCHAWRVLNGSPDAHEEALRNADVAEREHEHVIEQFGEYHRGR